MTTQESNVYQEAEAVEKPLPRAVLESETDGVLRRLLQDEPVLTPEEEAQAALAEMERDATAHLTPVILYHLVAGDDAERVAGIVLPHLSGCSWCCSTLREALRLCDAPQDHPAFAVLEDAQEWGRWDAAGATAAEAACRTLTEQGIGYVYGRQGEVYRRLPDGEEEKIGNGQEPPPDTEPTAL